LPLPLPLESVTKVKLKDEDAVMSNTNASSSPTKVVNNDSDDGVSIVEEKNKPQVAAAQPSVILKGTKEEADKAVNNMRNNLAQLKNFKFK